MAGRLNIQPCTRTQQSILELILSIQACSSLNMQHRRYTVTRTYFMFPFKKKLISLDYLSMQK